MRRFEFAIDRDHSHAVNETLADARRLRSYAGVAGVALAGTAGLLILVHDLWAYILSVVVGLSTLPALWVAVRRTGAVDALYAEGDLVPAVVSDVHPNGSATLLALVNLAKPDTATTRYALIARRVRSLPGHIVRPGECVPAVSVPTDRVARFGDGDGDGHWHSASVMPIAWATRDPAVLERGRAAISEVEWALLTDNRRLAAKAQAAEAKRLLLDPHQLPRELRH